MKIEISKFEESEDSLNEMAFKNPKIGKLYQVGDIVRVIKADEWITNYELHAIAKRLNDVDPDDALFYMRITDNSTKYIFGEILFINCGISWIKKIKIRNNKNNNVDFPGEEWNYIQPKFDEIKKLINKKWFIYGDEEVFMNIKGNKINPEEGIYTYNGYSLNFKLTRKFKEPVIGINLQNGYRDKFFYVKLSDIKDFFYELTAMEYEAIADWFNENTDMEVTTTEEYYFNIKQLWIFVDEGSNSDFLYNSKKGKENRKVVAGPFINMKQAKQMLEDLKKMEGETFYDKNKLIIDEFYNHLRYITVTLDELIEFARVNDIKADIKDILDSKSAVIAFKNFGF